MIPIQRTQDGFCFSVRVTPRGGKDVVLPFELGAECVKLKVSCPPEDGKANKAVLSLLAECLGVSKSSVSLLGGETSRNKRIGVVCQAPESCLESLAQAMGSELQACFTLSGP